MSDDNEFEKSLSRDDSILSHRYQLIPFLELLKIPYEYKDFLSSYGIILHQRIFYFSSMPMATLTI
jgi:hypothetical protein